MERATLIDLCPEGFEEIEAGPELELVAYVEAAQEAQIRARFEDVESVEGRAGWEDAWRSFHRPARIGRLWVGPPWELPDADSIPVVVDPGQAFGTGAHPTTRLCLELLLEQSPTSVVDIGCGSGVLAVAAAKLGFDRVVAIDLEPAAVAAARENARVNGVDVDIRLADAVAVPLPAAGLTLANLERQLVEEVAPRVGSPLLVCSGYLAADGLELPGWIRSDRRELDGWVAELYRR